MDIGLLSMDVIEKFAMEFYECSINNAGMAKP